MTNKKIYVVCVVALWIIVGIIAIKPMNSAQVNVPVAPSAPIVPYIGTLESKRPVYGHSVVPGGVATIAEAVQAYPSLDGTHAHFAMLPDKTCGSVSYERDSKMFWTKAKHCYPAGTLIITDGKIIILVRCGNQIGIAPPNTTETVPPSDLDTVVENYLPSVENDLFIYPNVETAPSVLVPTQDYSVVPLQVDDAGFLQVDDTSEIGGSLAYSTLGGLSVEAPLSVPICTSEPDSGLMLLMGMVFGALIYTYVLRK
jgi:hypothetical protein